MTETCPIALLPHPETTNAPVRSIAAELQRTPAGALRLCFELRGTLERVLIPPPQLPAAADGLWAHTCCEAFIGVAGLAAYREFNFSPSCQWAIYDFDDYRARAATSAPVPAPAITLRRDGALLTLEAVIEPAAVPAGAAIELGLSAVVEAADGTLSYWALHHPGARPDFHHRDAFTLTLSPAQR